MSAILGFLAATTFHPIFHPNFAPAIVGVANKYFQQPARLIFEMTNDPYSVFASEAIKGHNALVVVHKSPIPSLEEIKRTMNGQCDILIFLGPATDLPSKGDWDKLRWNPGGRVIVITQGDESRALRIIRAIWVKTRTKNVLLAAINNQSLEFYQWTPYRSDECRDVSSVNLIDVWKNGSFSRNVSLYMKTSLTNLNGCDLLYAATETYPFVFNNYTDGIEMEMFQLLAGHFNFSPMLVNLPAKAFWNARTYNGTHWTFSGAFKMLYEQDIDVVFSGLSVHIDRYEASIPVFPHMVETIVWTVPAPRVLSPIQNAFRTLSPNMWFWIIMSLCMASVAVYITQEPRCSTYCAAFFYTLGTLVNGMPQNRTKNLHLRIITITVIILAIHFFIAYQSTLILLLTTPILEKPLNMKQIIEENFTCYTYSAGTRLLELDQDDNIPKNAYTITHPVTYYFDDIAYNRTSFLLFPESPSIVLTARKYEDENGRNLVMRLQDPFMVLPISFYVAPGHPLAPLFGAKVMQMVDCGIVDYWNKQSRFYRFTTRDPKRQSLQPLTHQHLMGAFAVVIIAFIISIPVFILEVLVGKFYRRDVGRKRTQPMRRF